MRGIFIGLGMLGLGVAMLIYHECTRPIEQKPWWYSDSQVGWDHDHAVKPKGYDQISRYFIGADHITVIPWKPHELWAYSATASRRHQIINDKYLIRNVDGRVSFFVGNDQVHPPLASDPEETGKPLLECLAPEDDGTLLVPDPVDRPDFVEDMRARGIDVRTD